MKVRIILEDPTWRFKVRVVPVRPGRYAVSLRNNDGSKIEHGPSIGDYGFDEILARGTEFYRRLVEMLEANDAVAARLKLQPYQRVFLDEIAYRPTGNLPADSQTLPAPRDNVRAAT